MSALASHYDVIVVGGAAIGSAVAYFLAADPDFDGTVLIVERDPSFAQASTALSVSSIRSQFSNALNVEISRFGWDFMHEFGETMAVDGQKPDLGMVEAGYLFLAADKAQTEILQQNHAVQVDAGADVQLLSQHELAHAYPHLRVDDIKLASLGRSREGWFDNTALMDGFRRKARAFGAEYHIGEVVDLERSGGRLTGIRLKDGTSVGCGALVNAAGPRASKLAAMAGLSLPVEPRKRTCFVFDCAQSPQGTARVHAGGLPLMIDVTGVFCRPEGSHFIAGCSPPEDPAVDHDDFEPRYREFEEIIWPALAARSAAFEAIKLVRFWTGHYAYNTLDQNVIVGPDTQVPNFLYANGFSGHGIQQSPAIGRGLAEWIIHGRYRSLDLTPLGHQRVVANTPYLERSVI